MVAGWAAVTAFVLAAALACPATAQVVLTTSSLPGAVFGERYSARLEADGGTAPYRWAFGPGSGVQGLNLDAAGTLAGTPTACVDRQITIEVTDVRGQTASRAYEFHVVEPLVMRYPDTGFGEGTVEPVLSGGRAPFRYEVVDGSLPRGLQIDSSTGALSGVIEEDGLFAFIVEVKDADGRTASQSIAFEYAPFRIGPVLTTRYVRCDGRGSRCCLYLESWAPVPDFQFNVEGGELPPGLMLNGDGFLTGIPSQAGAFRASVRLTSPGGSNLGSVVIFVEHGPSIRTAELPAASMDVPYEARLVAAGILPPVTWSTGQGELPPGLSLEKDAIRGTPTSPGTYEFTVEAIDERLIATERRMSLTVESLAVTTGALPGAVPEMPYEQQLTAAGGPPAYRWSLQEGSLPPGLALGAAGVLKGSPSSIGNWRFVAQVADQAGHTASQELTLAVAARPTPLVFAQALPEAFAGVPYSGRILAGGNPPYAVSIASGALPDGMSLSADGVLSGTPAESGTYAFAIQATDAAAQWGAGVYTLSVLTAELAVAPDTLADAMVGQPYSQVLTVEGGKAPYQWSAVSGLPPGLTVDASTGELRGTPSLAGEFLFTVRVDDSEERVGARAFAMRVDAPALPDLIISAFEGKPSSQPLVGAALSATYPCDVAGRIDLTFVPDEGAGDPAVQFSTGRTAEFVIPAGETQAQFRPVPVRLQVGTVAGTVELAAGLTPVCAPGLATSGAVTRVAVPRSVPVVRAVRFEGSDVVVAGYTSARSVTSATFRYRLEGAEEQEVTLALEELFASWYKGPESGAFGGQFTLSVPLAAMGLSSPPASLTVVLANAEGAGEPFSVQTR